MGRADVLHIIDQAIWQEVGAALSGKLGGAALIQPDGMQLCDLQSAKSSMVMLFDTNTGELIAKQAIPFQPCDGYTSDGTRPTCFGQALGSNPTA